MTQKKSPASTGPQRFIDLPKPLIILYHRDRLRQSLTAVLGINQAVR